jgi:hypothetical protein
MSNGPSLIVVGATGQGYQTAPERAGQEASEGTFSAWMPADKAAGTETVHHNAVAAPVTNRLATFMVFAHGEMFELLKAFDVTRLHHGFTPSRI